jgi:hypothetical protein
LNSDGTQLDPLIFNYIPAIRTLVILTDDRSQVDWNTGYRVQNLKLVAYQANDESTNQEAKLNVRLKDPCFKFDVIRPRALSRVINMDPLDRPYTLEFTKLE